MQVRLKSDQQLERTKQMCRLTITGSKLTIDDKASFTVASLDILWLSPLEH
jgi:hypothetical protein